MQPSQPVQDHKPLMAGNLPESGALCPSRKGRPCGIVQTANAVEKRSFSDEEHSGISFGGMFRMQRNVY
jgi:hypothetical protein